MKASRSTTSTPNPLLPSDAARKQKNLFQEIFLVQYYYNLKNITPLKTWNLAI